MGKVNWTLLALLLGLEAVDWAITVSHWRWVTDMPMTVRAMAVGGPLGLLAIKVLPTAAIGMLAISLFPRKPQSTALMAGLLGLCVFYLATIVRIIILLVQGSIL